MSSSNPDAIHPPSAYKQPPAKRDTVHAISISVLLHWNSQQLAPQKWQIYITQNPK
jgi:hypothetical protein